MKNLVRFIVFVLFLLLLPSSESFAQKYSNEAILLYNSGVALHKQGKYELAEQKYSQALKIQPNMTESKKNLGAIYQNLAYKYFLNAQYEKSLVYAQKAASFAPGNANVYHTMGQCYSSLKDYDSAIAVYRKILTANPEDKIAQNNLEFVSLQCTKKNDVPIVTFSSAHIAPEKLYKLIKPASCIQPDSVESMKKIVDLVWSDPTGQFILQKLIEKKISINIVQGADRANAKKSQEKQTFYYMGLIPIFSYTSTSHSVNIPVRYITAFENQNASLHDKIYHLQVFIHEFGHAFMWANNSANADSMEEELGVSMLGYNIANKILVGRYLTKQEVDFYSKGCMQALLSDDHNKLPVYSGFTQHIQNYGVLMPYPEEYSDLVAIYKKLLAENKTKPVPNFYKYMR